MNIKRFTKLIGRKPWQHAAEWLLFLEFANAYFRDRKIKRPVVVELGVGLNRQKIFYEELLGAKYIGIDNMAVRKPDIVGDTHQASTRQQLKEMLSGEQINLLFIDAGHNYADVKRDYEIYSPMAKNIIALHDIITLREEVRLFWQELVAAELPGVAKITFAADLKLYGIGLLVKE